MLKLINTAPSGPACISGDLMRISAYYATVLLIASVTPAAPQGSDTHSGNSHYQGCKGFVAYEKDGDPFMRGTCAGIVSTLMGGWRIPTARGQVLLTQRSDGPTRCAGGGVFMDRNPGELHKSFGPIANTALREAWPCED